MKTIFFIRHAKSSWEEAINDHDRPLNPRGFFDADNVGKELYKKGIVSDIVYSSSANRAQTTARIVCENIGYPLSEIVFTKDLYDFDGASVEQVIKEFSNDFNSVIVFGHNPAFTTLANTLGSEIFYNLPTCGVVAISFKVNEWSKIETGKTEFYILPKELR